MNSYKEVYEEWFDSEDNVIVVSEDDTRQLVIGIIENIVFIGKIIKFNKTYDINIIKQFELQCSYPFNQDRKYFLYPVLQMYKILFYLVSYMQSKNIICDINNDGIDSYILKLSQHPILLQDFINNFRILINENIKMKDVAILK